MHSAQWVHTAQRVHSSQWVSVCTVHLTIVHSASKEVGAQYSSQRAGAAANYGNRTRLP